jgi:hypothetical protein
VAVAVENPHCMVRVDHAALCSMMARGWQY